MFGNTENVGGHHLPSSSSAAAAAAGDPTFTYPLLHHHHHLHNQQQQFHHTLMIPLPPPPPPSVPVPPFFDDDDELLRRDERLPHWSEQETRDLIETRVQVEWGLAAPAAKRAKNLWEVVAERMREKGYWRSGDQCKWKWKYLVNRYKGQETSDVDTVPPFFNEIHAVFTARANRIQQSQVEAETGVAKGQKRLNDASEDQSVEEFTAEQEDEEDIEAELQAGKGSAVPKRREKRQKVKEKEDPKLTNVGKTERFHNALQEIMRNFMEQQKKIDMEWMASMEKRAQERERFEEEWQQKMERLERERLMMEQTWKQREEERRLREESRAEKRDALLTALLNKLIHEESS